jgi:hypothetical protein
MPEMQTMNGVSAADTEDYSERDAARIAAREPLPLATADPVGFDLDPVVQVFGQKEHDLLIASIDHIAHDWTEQLGTVREHSKSVEQLVLERAAKVKADITALYLLGNAVVQEVKHGEAFNDKVGRELEKLIEGRT